MKVVILAGGLGTRISEETEVKPKPMIDIGGQPLLMHLMRNFSAQGFNEFVICLGYKGYVIKEYFSNLKYHLNDLHFDQLNALPTPTSGIGLNWIVDLVDTGQSTLTGGRLKRVREFTGNEPFILTYGDGLSDVKMEKVIQFHKDSKVLATVTAVKPPARFGAVEIADDGKVERFNEKFDADVNWINGGFFVLEQGVFNFIDGDSTTWEQEPLMKLAEFGQLSAYKHDGFWMPCDTLRDKRELESLWDKGAPWKNWND
jgi:glucose-1-phosphate cytidylyltransferase